MPNRLIRESSLTSETLYLLSAEAERMFFRLTLVADDAGRFDADPRVLLARCFPLKVGAWKPERVCKWRDELVSSGVIVLYENGSKEKIFGYFPSWSKHQRSYGLASKFPDPPGHPSIRPESGIHQALLTHLHETKMFCGHSVSSVESNVRAGSGYADLVLMTLCGRIVVELKRTRADMGAISQLSRYRAALKDVFTSVVIAAGLGPTLEISQVVKAGFAVITYDEHGKTKVSIKNKEIQQCYGLLIHANSREITTRSYSYPRVDDRKRDSKVESGAGHHDHLKALKEFTVSQELKAWAIAFGISNPENYLDEFKDYWLSVDGKRKGGRLVFDWDATFRNRLRELKANGRLQDRGPGVVGT